MRHQSARLNCLSAPQESSQYTALQFPEFFDPLKIQSVAMASTMMAKTFLGASLAKAVPTSGKVGLLVCDWRTLDSCFVIEQQLCMKWESGSTARSLMELLL